MDEFNSMADVQTVFVHEVGHVAGLDHPDANWITCDDLVRGAEAMATLNHLWEVDHSINFDDLAGMQAQY